VTEGIPILNKNISDLFALNARLQDCYQPYRENPKYDLDDWNRSESCKVCAKHYLALIDKFNSISVDYEDEFQVDYFKPKYTGCVDVEEIVSVS
jgi:hypothetical protein